jgi:hypothetical protein
MKISFYLILQLFLQIISSRYNLHTYRYEAQKEPRLRKKSKFHIFNSYLGTNLVKQQILMYKHRTIFFRLYSKKDCMAKN